MGSSCEEEIMAADSRSDTKKFATVITKTSANTRHKPTTTGDTRTALHNGAVNCCDYAASVADEWNVNTEQGQTVVL